MQFDGIIFDFDGVLLESESEDNRHLAELLTALGYPTTTEEALTFYMGLSGRDFLAAVERRIGCVLTQEFHDRRAAEYARVLRDGHPAVAGAVAFVRSLPADLPKAVASSSRREWIRTHLRHLGLAEAFGDHLYSGGEQVARGKPAPDIYLFAAKQLGVPIGRCVVIEDSEVGATAALASGAPVIGLVAGTHCRQGHEDKLRARGVTEIARSFDEVRTLLALE